MKRLVLILAIAILLLCSCGGYTDPTMTKWSLPWHDNAIEDAASSQTIHFYFMSDCGMEISPEKKNAEAKWGDCCLVVLPDGTTILIDAAMAQYSEILKGNLHRLGVERLDYLVISHPHVDHASGVYDRKATILKEFEVGHCYLNGVYNANWSDSHQLEKILALYGVPYSNLSQGDSFDVAGVHFSVLNPSKEIVGATFDKTPDINNSSLVLRMDYGEFSALFVGDLHAEKERELALECPDSLDVDLLKIPHHGYPTSSTTEFIDATSPALAVATGYVKMPFDTYRSYSRAGAQVLYDFTDGYIHVWSDDQKNIGWTTSRTRSSLIYD